MPRGFYRPVPLGTHEVPPLYRPIPGEPEPKPRPRLPEIYKPCPMPRRRPRPLTPEQRERRNLRRRRAYAQLSPEQRRLASERAKARRHQIREVFDTLDAHYLGRVRQDQRR